MVKVDVISGFLGAGKTTLIKKIFESVLKKEKVVLIENEFGEIGIDGTFLKESGIQIKEINAGCICCSLVGDFATSMDEVISKYNPERIIIEPSGVGKLSDIVNAVLKLKEELQINILATVVDGLKTKMYLKNFGEFFNNQVEAANTIVISKTDRMSEEAIMEVVNLVKEKNNHATIITTPINELDSEQLLKVLESKVSLKEDLIKEMAYVHEHEDDDDDDHDCCCHHDHEHHHDDDECCCHHDHEHHHDDDDDDECCCHHDHEHHHHDDDEECCCHHDHKDEEHEHHHHHHHHADEVFTSWGKETPKSVSRKELEDFLNALASDESLGIIVRSKGVLKANDNEKWYYFDYVSGDYEIRLGNPDYNGRIVVIGSKLNEEKIEKLFFKGE
ncbi:MAG: GTP-binding protein [Candidatus Caccosoma sp.]|nr:GTP-binding protein [Candidatus Caccosoma sp.]